MIEFEKLRDKMMNGDMSKDELMRLLALLDQYQFELSEDEQWMLQEMMKKYELYQDDTVNS